MSFWDRLGDAFDKIPEDVSLGDTFSAIGNAWSTAMHTGGDNNWFTRASDAVSDPVTPFTDAITAGLGQAGEALNWAYSYGVSRPISTVNQMSTNLLNGQVESVTQADAWNEAWNRSEEISLGQSAVTTYANIFEPVKQIGPNWMTKSPDPFSPLHAKDREDYFHNTWGGKLSSGALDAVGVIAADPGYIGLKAAARAQRAKTTVDAADRAAVLAKGAETGNRKATTGFDIGVAPSRELEDGTKLTRKQADQGQRTSELIDRIVAKPRHEIQAMPELQGHADANSLAILMQRAKDTYPDDAATQRKAIADVLGTAWGDTAAMGRLTARRDALALDAERITSVPPQNLYAWRAPGWEAKYDTAAVRAVQIQRNAIDNEMARLDEVISHSGQQLGPVRVGSTAYERASEATALRAMNESYLHTGFASAPLRMVTAAAGTRIPDHINVKDAALGYDDMVNTLRLMRYTEAGTKQKIMDSFVRASTPAARMNVVKMTREQIVKDAAKRHGLTEKQAVELIRTGEGRMEKIRSNLGARLYSAAGDERFVQSGDIEDDIIHVFDKPFLKTMLEDAHPMIDPREVDTALKTASRNRLLDNLGPAGTATADTFGTVKDVTADVLNMATKLWKTAALMRGAYPLRIMTDTQARQMVHMEAQVFMATRYESIGGLKTYLMTQKDGEGKSLRNFFKEGDTEAAVTAMLTRDLGEGSIWNLTPEDVPGIVRTVLQQDGGMADLANEVGNVLLTKRRTGDFGTIEPNNPEWTKAYLRAVNQQILNSPVAMQALATPDIYELKRLVRSKPELMKEARETGAKFDTHEDWLRAVVAANNHLLPTPELRIMAMRRGTNKIRVPRADSDRVYKARNTVQEKLSAIPRKEADRTPEQVAEREELLKQRHKLNGMLRRLGEDTNYERTSQFNEREITALFGGKEPKIKPMPIHGEGFSVIEQGKTVATYNKVRNGYFNFAASMPENIMGRSPMFWDAYRKAVRGAIERLDEEQISYIGVDAIRANAMKAARKQVGQILFDGTHSSNMANSMRLLSPFFSAWEDTMSKWGKLFYDNPALFSRINQGSQALNDSGLVVDQNGYRVDATGRSFDVSTGERMDNKPGYEKGSESIFLPSKLVKGKVPQGGVKIRKDSINSVFQGEPWWLPGFGPLVALPMNRLIRDIYPKEVNDPIIKYILPYGTTNDSELKQLAPKYLKSWMNAFGDGQAHQNQYKVFLAEAVIDERNGGPKVDLDKVANRTRNYFILKGAVDNLSPVSITPSPKYQFYIDQAHKYRADPKRTDWQADFDKDFPGFGEIKMELAANETGIQATAEAFDEQQRYRKDIAKNEEFGWMYVGPANAAGTYNGAVHDWQVEKGFRSQKKPYEALKDLQAEQGWDKYSQMRTLVSLELEKRGLVSIQQKGAEDLQFILGEYRTYLGSQNSAWSEAYNSASAGGNKPQVLLDKAQEFMSKHKEVRTRPDMVALRKYMDMRNAIRAQLDARPNKSLAYNPDLKYVFDSYTQTLVQDNYGFEQMYNRVLEYDNLSQEVA